MADFESPKKKKKTPKKDKEENENPQESIIFSPKEDSQDLKRKSQSSSDDEVAVKKPKTVTSKVTNGHVDGSPSSTKWSLKEEEDLLKKVDEYLKNREEAEGTKKPIYIKHIDWSQIDSGDHTPEEAQQRFLVISNRVRKMRTAREVLQDMREIHRKTPVSSVKKKEVDPDLPKKPHTPYIRFVMAKRQGIAERHPEMKNLEITRKLGSKWNKLSDEKKKKYLDRYHEEMESYTLQLVDYLKNHNPEIIPPKTKFELWAEDEEKKIREGRPDISEKKLAKKLRRRWENLEEEDKAKWEEKAKKEVKKFRNRIAKAKSKPNSGQNLESSSEAKSDV